jgi:hypothetical protein
VIVAYMLLAAPIVAAALFWGSWAWVALAAIVCVVEYVTLRRSERFSARVWRSVGVGHRSSRERTTERVYVASASAGVLLVVGGLLARFSM